jgi:hypothetical protein
MIYQNVLTHPRGLISTAEDELAPGFIPYSGIGRGARGATGQYPSPLQYVCRQLHYETKNLLLKHNSCVFKGEREAIYKTNRLDRDVTAVIGLDHFFNFIYGCGTPGPKGLRKVDIQYEGSDDMFMILADDSPLSIFCPDNPSVQVIIRFRVMFIMIVNPGKHLEITNLFSLLFRGRLAHKAPPVRTSGWGYAEAARLAPRASRIHLPPNLRISTMIDEEFCVEHIRVDDITRRFWLPDLTTAQIKEMVAAARMAFREGVWAASHVAENA